MRLQVSRSIDAAPERVWRVLQDVEGWPGWTPSMNSVEYVEGRELAAGTRVRIRQPRLPAAVWRVSRVDAGSYFEWRASGPGINTVAGHRVEPAANGGSLVTLSIEQKGPAVLLMGWWLKGITERYVNMEADGLKARCENMG